MATVPGNLIRFNEPTGFEWQASAGDGFLQSPAERRRGGRSLGRKELCGKDVETLSERQAARPPTHAAMFTFSQGFSSPVWGHFKDSVASLTPLFQQRARWINWQQMHKCVSECKIPYSHLAAAWYWRLCVVAALQPILHRSYWYQMNFCFFFFVGFFLVNDVEILLNK